MSQAGAGERWRPPRGRHRLPQEVVVASQRRRLLDAAVQVGAGKGVAEMTIGDLTAAAGVSRTTFYELFDDKHACYLAAHDDAVEALLRTVGEAYEARQRWPERVCAGLAALLDGLAADPAMAKLTMVDVGTAGPAGQRRHRALVRRLAPLFEEGRDFATGSRALPANTSRMAIGSVSGMIGDEVLAGNASELRELLSDLLFATLVAYIGPDAAAAEVDRLGR